KGAGRSAVSAGCGLGSADSVTTQRGSRDSLFPLRSSSLAAQRSEEAMSPLSVAATVLRVYYIGVRVILQQLFSRALPAP
ncbi:hypothetical protein NDU88_004520, partial [Pleurodeles waltl]